MALEQYQGVTVLEVDGQEIEIISLDITENTGRKPVKTMNRNQRINGFSKGVSTYEISVTAAIPVTGEIDWAAIENAKITIYAADDGGDRISYLDCATESVGAKYSVDNEAVRDLKLFAARKVIE